MNQWGFTPTTPRKWSTRSGILTYAVSLPILTDRSSYRWLGFNKFGIIGQPVPLSGLPRQSIVRPLRKVGWRKFEYPSHPHPTLTTAISHRRYAGTRNNEASLPLHKKWATQSSSRIWSGPFLLVLSVLPNSSILSRIATLSRQSVHQTNHAM